MAVSEHGQISILPALQAPLSMTKTEPPLSLEASVHVHSCCSASAHTLLLPEERTVCLASGSWESSMSYFEVAWLVPVILHGVGKVEAMVREFSKSTLGTEQLLPYPKS